MDLFRFVLRNQLFHWKKVLLTVLITGLMLFAPLASIILTSHIKTLAEKPLQSLGTELILQDDQKGSDPGKIRTAGLILPFNLRAFGLAETREKMKRMSGVNLYSTALVLWQFDLNNTRTVIALNCNDPAVGMRKIESFLMPGGRFFLGNDTKEVILERHFARLYGYKLNRTFAIAKEHYRIVGIVDFKERSNLSTASVFLPYGTGLRLSNQSGQVINQVFLSLHSSSDRSDIAKDAQSLFPGYSLITKDSLLKNLSSFNSFLYRFGNYFIVLVLIFSIVLTVWIMKIFRLDFAFQKDILKIIGWPRKELFLWQFYDTSIIVCTGLCFAFVLAAILAWGVLPILSIGPLLNQGFKL